MTEFFKYNGLGNDFIIVSEKEISPAELTPENVTRLCDRHLGIGADGILLHSAPEKASHDAKMTICNSDGSIAEMCGNGIRCFALYLIQQCGFSKDPMIIETGRGPLEVRWEKSGDSYSISANIGRGSVIAAPETLRIGGCEMERCGISMGNPHLVYFGKDLQDLSFSAHELWKERELGYETNVEVITHIDLEKRRADAIVFERGCGYTQACGTGGAAIVNSLYRMGHIGRNEKFTVKFPGGELGYTIDDSEETVICGPADFVFTGRF